jgi:hypothetical protein
MVYGSKGPGTDFMAMILCPAPKDWVESLYQLARRQMSGTLDDASDLSYDRVPTGLGRLYQHLGSVLTNVLPEEVKSLFDVRDDRLIRRELKASFRKESFHQGTDLLFKDLTRGAGDNKVVSVSDQVHLLVGTDREVLPEQHLQSVQGEVGQRRRDDAALGRTIR